MENLYFGQKVNVFGYGSEIFEISEVHENSVRLRRNGGQTLLGSIPFDMLKPVADENEQDFEHYDTLKVIKALNLFFYNYTGTDIEFLQVNSNEFSIWWQNNLDSDIPSFQRFWNAWASADLSYKTQIIILERALERYGNEAERSVSRALNYNN